jgi:hypothetical protein
MGILDKLEHENHHIAEEMVEHLILERIGALPDHGHAKAIKLKKRVRPRKTVLNAPSRMDSNFWFYTISFLIVIGELWFIGDFILTEYPNLENLFR